MENELPFTAASVRAACLDLPGAFEDFPFGPETVVYKVRASASAQAKVFALLWESGDQFRVNLKCDPALAEQLRRDFPQITPGYHMNKVHWNSVTLPVPWKFDDVGLQSFHVLDMIEDSYDLVVSSLPKKDRLLLGWSPHPAH